MKTRKNVPPFKNWPKVAPQIVCATSASWAMLCTGLVRGWSSSAIPQLTAPKNDTLYLSQEEAAWITSLPPLCAVFGSLLISLPMQLYGRRMALVAMSIPYVIGFYLMGLSHYVKWTPLLFIGRIITGLLTGASAPTSQIYVSECSSPRVRGALGSFTATFLSLGVLIAYIIGALVEWHILCFVIGSLPVILGLAMFFMPETPSWLVSHNREPQARVALQQLRGKHTDIETEFQRIKNNDNTQTVSTSYATVLTTASLVKPLFISMALMFFQQFSGINAIIFYSARIFQEAGSSIDRFVSSIMIGIVQMVFTMISALMVDRFGRRILLMVSGTFMAISLTGLGVFVYLKEIWEELLIVDESTVAQQTTALQELGWIPLACLMSFIIAYSIGFGAVPHLIMGELFPVEHRSRLGTISSSFNLCCTFLVVRTFPDVTEAVGLAGAYGIYAGCSLIAVFFVGFFLPETKGRTLEEIGQLFGLPAPKQTSLTEQQTPLSIQLVEK